jgi:hypothetical protein
VPLEGRIGRVELVLVLEEVWDVGCRGCDHGLAGVRLAKDESVVSGVMARETVCACCCRGRRVAVLDAGADCQENVGWFCGGCARAAGAAVPQSFMRSLPLLPLALGFRPETSDSKSAMYPSRPCWTIYSVITP